MKKILFFIPFLLALLTACHKDDESSARDTDYSYKMDYGVKVCDTILHYYNITAHYRDANSQTVSEPITKTEWTKHIDDWGDSLELVVSFSLRPDVDTSYTNPEWLIIDSAYSRINTRLECFAYAVSTNRDGGVSKIKGKPYYTPAFNPGEYRFRTWTRLTSRLNSKGDYAHYSLD